MGPRHEVSFCACKTAWLAPELLVSMGPIPHLRFSAFKRATLGPELHFSMCPWPYLRFCVCKTACLASELLVSIIPALICCFWMHKSDFWSRITSLYGSQIWNAFCACKTARWAPEILVSMGPFHHLWCLHAKQKLLDQNYKCLWVPDLTCRFVHAKQRL